MPLQLLGVSPEQLVAHVPKLQTWPAVHLRPQAPQLFTSLKVFEQVPLQLVCPNAHWQVLLEQVPPEHDLPQPPQWSRSVAVCTHRAPQRV